MLLKITKTFQFTLGLLLVSVACYAQLTIPWSPVLNLTMGHGASNPGSPIPTGNTPFIYTTDTCPAPGFYTVVNKINCPSMAPIKDDAGHIFFLDIPLFRDTGYMLLVNAAAASVPTVFFKDTINGLCSSTPYLLWAAIMNGSSLSCVTPNMTISAETLSGQVIQSFQTGNIGGSPDNGT